jgi:hypothetical protein
MALRGNGRAQGDRLVEGEPSIRSRTVREAAVGGPTTDELLPDALSEPELEEPGVDQVRTQLGRVADHIRGLRRELAEFDPSRHEELHVAVSPLGESEENGRPGDGEEPLGDDRSGRVEAVDDAIGATPDYSAMVDEDLLAAVESEAESLRALAVAEARSDAAAIRAEAEREAAELVAIAQHETAELRAAATEEARDLRAAATDTVAELSAEIEALADRLAEEIATVRADAERIRADVKEEAERVLADANREAQELRRRMIAGARAEAQREAIGARAELAEGVGLAANTAISRITRGEVQDLQELMTSLEREPADTGTVQDVVTELALAAAVLDQSVGRLAITLSALGADRAPRSAD